LESLFGPIFVRLPYMLRHPREPRQL
jgi:hypothetical protein